MNNERLRLRAVITTIENAKRDVEENNNDHSYTDTIKYARACGRLEGMAEVLLNDFRFWLEEAEGVADSPPPGHRPFDGQTTLDDALGQGRS